MRITEEPLFAWACEDRAEDLPRFRQFARRWHPVVRRGRNDDSYAFPPLQFGRPRADGPKPLPRPTWSPWLWVK
jgi:hypothetical protein